MVLQQWPRGFIGMSDVVRTMPTNLNDTEGAFGFIEELLHAAERTITLLLDTG